MERCKFLLGHLPCEVLADSAYATGPHLAYAQQNNILLYSPWQEKSPSQDRPQEKAPQWLPKNEFVWLGENEGYVCPMGKRLELSKVRTQQRSQGERVRIDEYRCSGLECQKCPLAVWCTSNPEAGRTINRSEHEEKFERLQQRMQTEQGKQKYKLRCQTVELGFADLKEHRGLRRFSGRGQQRAEAQVGLCVLVNNGLVVERALEGITP